MPIILTEYESHDGMREFVSCAVKDFADDRQIRDVLDEFETALRVVKGSSKQWRRQDDAMWAVPGGLLKKYGGKKALDKAQIALMELGYSRLIERKVDSTFYRLRYGDDYTDTISEDMDR